MAYTLAQRLQSLGVATQLAQEIEAQIDAGVGDQRRLQELGIVPLGAEYLAGAITAGTVDRVKLAQWLVPDVAREIAKGNNVPPRIVAAPVLSGTPEVNETLTTTNGTWSSVSSITYAIEWFADGVVIPGETGATYDLTASEEGKEITTQVTATNAHGSTVATSNSLGPVDPAP